MKYPKVVGAATFLVNMLVPCYGDAGMEREARAEQTSHSYQEMQTYRAAGIGNSTVPDQIDYDCDNVPLKKAAIKALKGHSREFLPPAVGSYKVGKNIILDINEFKTVDKGKTQFEIVQGGNFRLVAVQTGAGIYIGVPDEPIRTGVTLEELVRLFRGEKVSGTVMGIDDKVEQAYKVLFSYTGEPK